MKWIKASERLPDENMKSNPIVKWEQDFGNVIAVKCSYLFFTTLKHYSENPDKYLNVEWIDESIPVSDQPPQPEKKTLDGLTPKQIVEQNFKGLHYVIGDKEISDFYLQLIEDILIEYSKMKQVAVDMDKKGYLTSILPHFPKQSESFGTYVKRMVDPDKISDADKLNIAWRSLQWVGFTRGDEFSDDDVLRMLDPEKTDEEIGFV